MKRLKILFLFAFAPFCGISFAENVYWAGGQTGNWSDAGTWTNETGAAATTKSQAVYIQGADSPVVTFSDSTDAPFKLWIGVAANQEGTLVIESGNLTASGGVQLGSGLYSCGTIIQNGGTFKCSNSINLGLSTSSRVGYYYMNGGTLTFTKLGPAVGNQGNGYFYMNGGTVSAKTLTIFGKLPGAGVSDGQFVLKGGSFTCDTSIDIGLENGPTKPNTFVNPLLRIVGSKGELSTAGNFRIYAPEGIRSKFRVEIDEDGISPVTGTGASSTAVLNGTLEAGVANGVVLTGLDTFDVLSGFAGITDAFATLPDSGLWDATGVVQEDGAETYAYRIGLAESACKDEFSANISIYGKTEFSPCAKGYVRLNDLQPGRDLRVRMAVDTGDVSTADYIAGLVAAGVNAAACEDDDDFNVVVTFQPASQTAYFVWDVSDVSENAGVSAVAAGEKLGCTVILVK